MPRKWFATAVLAATALAGCQSSADGPTATLGNQNIGTPMAPGGERRLTLPPTQYERVHFLGRPGQKVQVVVEGPGAAPLSLSIFPVVATGEAGRFANAPKDFALKPFQRTAPLPLSAEVVLPAGWKSTDAVVVELKNIGGTVAEPTLKLEGE
ncbi:hypothetical protein [Gloeobacter violaceus]|uniref:Gll0408 protein n=1 Tax=Gloeobacter violaceus (strain ATCC 29082 / PCC 7421) TaxID=251221 RepID=Q7NNK3_GLOVI|nr:hypothetical protein [Gloeobacter violaceus]BAC88349.1 gll0408 [Gloeobacter violaceus PCC 7421]